MMISLSCTTVLVLTRDTETNFVRSGVIWALVAALSYALIVIGLRNSVDHEDELDIPMFLGCVGFFNCILFWPGLIILHVAKIEVFELPTLNETVLLLINGLVGTAFSELLWLWGCLLTSSLITTLSVSLVIPMMMLVDLALAGSNLPRLFLLGTISLVVSILSLIILTAFDRDPLSLLINKLVRCLVLRRTEKTIAQLNEQLFENETV
jgi:solute carrier family 35 protein F5